MNKDTTTAITRVLMDEHLLLLGFVSLMDMTEPLENKRWLNRNILSTVYKFTGMSRFMQNAPLLVREGLRAGAYVPKRDL